MKNRLSDLNDHLFMAIERLGDETLTADQIETEAKRASAIVQVADQVIANSRLQLDAVKVVVTHGDHVKRHLPMLAGLAIEGSKA